MEDARDNRNIGSFESEREAVAVPPFPRVADRILDRLRQPEPALKHLADFAMSGHALLHDAAARGHEGEEIAQPSADRWVLRCVAPKPRHRVSNAVGFHEEAIAVRSKVISGEETGKDAG